MSTTGASVRRLIRSQDRASLATLLSADGTPYASLVLYATLADATPVLLLSDLAEHTKNLKADPRASLLIDGTAGLADPLTGARATLVGRLEGIDASLAQSRYVARHPSAEAYVGFGDFRFYALRPTRAHLVSGFGRIQWIDAGDILDTAPSALVEREGDIVEHMNEDHAEAIGLYATRLLGRNGGAWRMTGIDPDGADLRHEGEVARLEFSTRIEDAEAARREFVRLVKEARAKESS